MTAIACCFGNVPAAALRERDRVRARDGSFVQILHLSRSVLDQDFLTRHPDAMPIRIRAGALGPGLPAADVLVSPSQHIAAIPGRLPAPRRAADLLAVPGVYRQPETGLSYTQLILARAAEIQAHGLWFAVDGPNPSDRDHA